MLPRSTNLRSSFALLLVRGLFLVKELQLALDSPQPRFVVVWALAVAPALLDCLLERTLETIDFSLELLIRAPIGLQIFRRCRPMVLLAAFSLSCLRVRLLRLFVSFMLFPLLGPFLLLDLFAVFCGRSSRFRLHDVVQQLVNVLALEFLVRRVVATCFVGEVLLKFVLLPLLLCLLSSLVHLVQVIVLLKYVVLLDAFAVAKSWIPHFFPMTFILMTVGVSVLADLRLRMDLG
jgi:hypothetical protein